MLAYIYREAAVSAAEHHLNDDEQKRTPLRITQAWRRAPNASFTTWGLVRARSHGVFCSGFANTGTVGHELEGV